VTDDDIIDEIVAREGGYVDHPADRGGPTNRGITLQTLAAWRGRAVTAADVAAMGETEARDIYRRRYIEAPGFHRIQDDALRSQVIDCAVLHGPHRAAKLLQAALGVAQDGIVGRQTLAALDHAPDVATRLAAHRLRYIAEIVAGNPSQVAFLRGWVNRATEFLIDQPSSPPS
jgi:lysozyme family protein